MTAILEGAKELVVNKWETLNTAASPTKLPDGHSPNNLNVWMDEKPGSVVTANGYFKLGEIPSGNPPTLLLNFFKTSDGSSQLIVSDNATIWYTTNYVDYTSIKTGLSQSFQLRGKVIRDKVWFTNGSDDVATWDGTTYTELDGTGGTPDVPAGKYIEYHDERVWIYGIASDLSACRFSALTDTSGTEITPENSAAWPTDNEIQISEGDADQGTGIFLYRGYLYCSKQFSFWRIVGYDEYTYTRVKTRSSTGTRFQESIQIKDNLVHFIGVDGLYVFDGEESRRISDIIDPASAEAGVFAFRNLQQPLLNNQFWNVSETSDIDDGTLPNNLSANDDKISLVPADDTNADFNSGTHDDTIATGDNLQLDIVASGGSPENVAVGETPSLPNGGTVIGVASSINDESLSASCGYNSNGSGLQTRAWQVVFAASKTIGSVTLKSFYAELYGQDLSIPTSKLQYYDGSSWNDVSGGAVSLPSSTFDASYTRLYNSLSNAPNPGPTYYKATSDIAVDFPVISCLGLRYLLVGDAGAYVLKELQIFRAGYEADGKFISSPIDYALAPASFGSLASDIVSNGEAYQFFTQSSPDGSTWDSEVNVSNGGAIGSTLQRYLRWGVYLYSSTGLNTPVIHKVFVGGTYLSEIHDTGGNILQWAALQIERNAAGQTINAYFRAGTSAAAVLAASWTAIVPGAVPNTATTNTFIQIRLEFSTTNVDQVPVVNGFTVNWIVSSASGAAVLQNVASFIWLNRYWLAAATLGASENDIVLVLGKSTFGSPWHKRDFKLLSFCRFLDVFIAGSSEDGSIYRLEYGYSKNGSAMDSYYETRDFSFDDFQMKGREILVTADRSGPYDLFVGWSTDGGLTYEEKEVDLTRDDGASLSFTKRLNVNFMSDGVRFRVRTNAADQPFSVDSIKAYFRPIIQRGSLS